MYYKCILAVYIPFCFFDLTNAQMIGLNKSLELITKYQMHSGYS